ncbi:MAG: coproporphyrinogen dehydrogenase HemZ [Clostridia bacterium]|nr:coproporphyrinogen dehydrogenase HemZ [Clostridia bacterium]
MERVIKLQTDAPSFFSDICEVIRLFKPKAEITLADNADLVHTHTAENGEWKDTWRMDGREACHFSKAAAGDELYVKRMYKRAVKTALFLLMREETGVNPPWGSLTGIRPTRLAYEARDIGMNAEEAVKWLKDEFFVCDDRARLLEEILEQQKGIVDVPDDEYDVYISIPFCVTRCSYCSFSSGTIGDGKLVDPYIRALLTEMEAMSKFLGHMKPRAVYVGGGTPTSITAWQLNEVLQQAAWLFPGAVEFTVEAGRPDTIDRDKLAVIKNANATRISVNPQTFRDKTLDIIGRRHTSEDTVRAYLLAREMGFDDINMDIIAALPGEGMDAFSDTLGKCVELSPESVTVHSLAIKHSSKLNEKRYEQSDSALAGQMTDEARRRLTSSGYRPYYLYRQKYMAGNLENVGYAKPGRACLYNIGNMEETARVLALGAGAITKWLFPAKRRIERAANLKSIEQYIARTDEMIARKKALIGGHDA